MNYFVKLKMENLQENIAEQTEWKLFKEKRAKQAELILIICLATLIFPGWYVGHLTSTVASVILGAAIGLFGGYHYTKYIYRNTTPDDGILYGPWIYCMLGTICLPLINYMRIGLMVLLNK